MRRTACAAIFLAAMATPGVCASYDDLNTGIQYFNAGSLDNAITSFDKVIAAGDLIPDLIRVAYLDRGISHRHKGNYEKAVLDLTQALARKPDDVIALGERAAAYKDLEQLENALADYSEILRNRPKDRNTAFYAGLLNWELARYGDAANVFAGFSSNNVYAWLWLQLCNKKQGAPVTSPQFGGSLQTWPFTVAAFYRGEATEEAVLESARKGSNTKRRTCEAHFYIGQWRLAHDDRASGKSSLQNAVENCEKDQVERRLAVSGVDLLEKGEAQK